MPGPNELLRVLARQGSAAELLRVYERQNTTSAQGPRAKGQWLMADG